MSWIDVDRKGLAKILERRGKAFALLELLSNAWDTDAKTVDIQLEAIAGRPLVAVTVRDDDPNGFKDLTHAFTLFAESVRKGDSEKRGRFNMGEKLVLALCDEAKIITTTGGVRFEADERHTSRERTEAGSVFTGRLRMTRDELAEVEQALSTVIPPAGVTTTINGKVIQPVPAFAETTADLPTELADAEGMLRRTVRKARVTFHEVPEGQKATLYEMGIPVVELAGGERWHVNVHQKVPLNMDRDNVTPAYLRTIRGLVLDTLASCLSPQEAAAVWVTEGIGATKSDDAVRAVVSARFGPKSVTYDPSDRGANQNAQAEGYAVVYGGMLPTDAWDRVREAEALLPAGQVTPDLPKFGPGTAKLADMAKWVNLKPKILMLLAAITPEAGWTLGFYDDPDAGWAGLCAKDASGTTAAMSINFAGKSLDPQGRLTPSVIETVLHEAAHFYEAAHLHTNFHKALQRLGAAAASFASHHNDLFA